MKSLPLPNIIINRYFKDSVNFLTESNAIIEKESALSLADSDYFPSYIQGHNKRQPD